MPQLQIIVYFLLRVKEEKLWGDWVRRTEGMGWQESGSRGQAEKGVKGEKEYWGVGGKEDRVRVCPQLRGDWEGV